LIIVGLAVTTFGYGIGRIGLSAGLSQVLLRDAKSAAT
jgi:hypothetical protein